MSLTTAPRLRASPARRQIAGSLFTPGTGAKPICHHSAIRKSAPCITVIHSAAHQRRFA
ncbi:hypothetical protein A33K_13232 [Burkholderia humptydooensis MSMB43]|uniref:Uncharacterized protein n=1 Tax=Burkholderia humptydooensis MSMB43 TaxID=441157 RepID=A0ABN0GBR7_9BURK|nr:hypothetical protein A33K_13232 [Burkholderia humptydooensis MSMB43]